MNPKLERKGEKQHGVVGNKSASELKGYDF